MDTSQGQYEADGSWTSRHFLFKSLTSQEVEKFRQYARDTPAPPLTQQTIMHPVCREVWAEMQSCAG